MTTSSSRLLHNSQCAVPPRPDHPEYRAAEDSVPSDVDVVGYHPIKPGIERVVVSCKSWQGGFDATAKVAELRGEKKNPKRETWRHFRELWIPKWSEAFREAIFELTNQRSFAYLIAVTRLKGDAKRLGKRSENRGEPQRLFCRLPSARSDVAYHARQAHDDTCVKRDRPPGSTPQGRRPDRPERRRRAPRTHTRWSGTRAGGGCRQRVASQATAGAASARGGDLSTPFSTARSAALPGLIVAGRSR